MHGMDWMTLLGFALSLLVGVSLGLIGSGGSILTVPILVYTLFIDPVLATAYSLFVVGTSALVGSFTFMRKRLVSYKTALIFGAPAIIAVYLTRKYLIPALPEVFFSIGAQPITKDIAIMVFFAVIMLLAAWTMIRGRKADAEATVIRYNYPLIILEGSVVGAVTGMVGAGGGFLIIPALVLLARLPMKLAVGTSLLIIAAKSLIGFLGDLGRGIDWPFLLLFTSIAIAGIFLGSFLSNFIKGHHLKKSFGYFLVIMSVYILLKELAF